MQDLFGADDLGFHEQAEHFFVVGKELGDDGGGGVGAVGGAECVIDIDIVQVRRVFRRRLCRLFLLLYEIADFPAGGPRRVVSLPADLFGLFADTVFCEKDRMPPGVPADGVRGV